jgi:hypothetical protein
MREFAAAFHARATDAGYELRLDAPLPWLTRYGHLAARVQERLPAEVLDYLRELFLALGGDERRLAAKTRGRMSTDFLLLPHARLVELDEIQHLTAERARTLDFYPEGVELGYAREEYRALCQQWDERAKRRFDHRQAAEFPRPGARHAQRAYFDAFRDLVAPYFGHGAVIRIAAPDRDAEAAFATFCARVHGAPQRADAR